MSRSVKIHSREDITKLHSTADTALHWKGDTGLHRVGVTHITIRFSVEAMMIQFPKWHEPIFLRTVGLHTFIAPTANGDLSPVSDNDFYDWQTRGPCATSYLRGVNRWMLEAIIAIDGREFRFPWCWPEAIYTKNTNSLAYVGWRPDSAAMPPYVWTNGNPVAGPLNPADGIGMKYTLNYAGGYAELQLRIYQYEAINITSTAAFLGGKETPLVPYEVSFTATEKTQSLDGITHATGTLPWGNYPHWYGDPLNIWASRGYVCTKLAANMGRAVCSGWGSKRVTPHGTIEGWTFRSEALNLPPVSNPAGHTSTPWCGWRTEGPDDDPAFPYGNKYDQFDAAYAHWEGKVLGATTITAHQRLRASVTYAFAQMNGEYSESWTRKWDKEIPEILDHKRYDGYAHYTETAGQTEEWTRSKSTELLINFAPANMRFDATIAPLTCDVTTNAEEVIGP